MRGLAGRSMVQSLVEPLIHGFDLARPPGLGEERFERAVEPQHREKALARNSLNPVAPFDTRRLGRTEIDHRGTVGGVRFGGGRREALAARAREALWRVEHRAR